MAKAQVTIFVVLGIIVIAMFSLAFYFREEIIRGFQRGEVIEEIAAEKKIGDAVNHITGCVDEVSNLALEFVPAQGGWLMPEKYFSYGDLSVGYWVYDGEDLSPSIGVVENELEKFVDFYFPSCMSGFYGNKFFLLAVEPSTEVKISEGKVSFDVSYPAIIIYNNITYSLPNKPFHYEASTELLQMHNAGKVIANSEVRDHEYVDLTMLGNLNKDITRLPYGKDSLYLVTGKTMHLMFATK